MFLSIFDESLVTNIIFQSVLGTVYKMWVQGERLSAHSEGPMGHQNQDPLHQKMGLLELAL